MEPLDIPEPIREKVERAGGLNGISARVAKQTDLEERSTIFKALADPLRLRILSILHVQPLCVCCIKEIIDISDSKLSYHLSILKDSGLIKGDQEKNWIIYRPTVIGEQFGFLR